MERKSKKQRFLGQFAWVTLGRIVAAILQALSLIMVARYLQPSEFGTLAVVLGLATVVQTVLDFGVSTYITRERAVRPSSGGVTSAIKFTDISSMALAVLVFLCILGAGYILSPLYYLMLPLSVWVSGERNADARLAVVFADGDAWINTINLVSRRLVGLAIFLGITTIGFDPLLAYCTSVALAALASSIFANVYVRRRLCSPSTLSLRELLLASRHYWLNSVATQARNLDVVVLGFVAGSFAAGLYASASKLSSPLRILPTSLASVLIPAATRAFSVGESLRSFVKSSAYLIGSVSSIYLILAFVSPWFVPIVLGDSYQSAVGVIQIILLGLPFAASASILNAMLQAIGEKRFVASAATIATIFCLSGVVMLGDQFGAIGAGIALSVSFVLQAAILGIRLTLVVGRINGERKY